MKGVPGLLIAIGLGIAGAFCNWFYMAQKSRELDLVQFVGIADGGIKAGEAFRREHLIPIPIPQRYAQRLKEAAPVYGDVMTIVGTTAYRAFRDGEILLSQDLAAPPGNDLMRDLGPNEQVIWVTVDSRGFEPAYLSGGQQISFLVPRLGSRGPTPASSGPPVAADTEVIGPFDLMALGNRRGSYDRAKAAGMSLVRENVLAIRVKRISATQLEPKAQDLIDRLRLSNNQALGIVLHPDKRLEASERDATTEK